MKSFNTTGVCIPSKHYMVDISDRLAEITKLIDDGKYFTINRARQYGKTTTLTALRSFLGDRYTVLSLDFQGIGNAGFSSEKDFVQGFCRLINRAVKTGLSVPAHIRQQIQDLIHRTENKAEFAELFDLLLEWCAGADKPVVLLIDEVDSASNNQVFLDFLAQLRLQYLEREKEPAYKTFQSVVLSGVTDVRYLRRKIRSEDVHNVNSPWNIAADFNIDMSLSKDGIQAMLQEYEADHHSGMSDAALAKLLRDYTDGYPFLVSRLCELIDTRVVPEKGLSAAWSKTGFEEAVRLILAENNTLFQSLTKNLNNYPELKEAIRSILMEGTKLAYNAQQDDIIRMQMYGLIVNDRNTVRVANRIFETMLYNLFLTEEELKSNVFSRAGDLGKNHFVEDHKLNMRAVLTGFIQTYTEIFGPLLEKFKEKDGREQFLLYLKPIINGTGNYYIEAQTRDQTRTDVIVDYLGQQYIVELKIWRGERYNAAGEQQIVEYLDYFGLATGYMLSFNFNKKKETGLKQVHISDKLLYEATI